MVVGVPDPWEVLGIAPGAPVGEARAARRRLAKDLHPDVHGGRPESEQAELATRMAMVNWALDRIEGAEPEGAVHNPCADTGSSSHRASVVWSPTGELDTFSMERLPAEAFEALFVAVYGLGDILVADEPYLLEVFLNDPPCFCRLSLAPEAGGSLVTVDVSPADPADIEMAPDPTTVVAVLTAELDSLLQP